MIMVKKALKEIILKGKKDGKWVEWDIDGEVFI